MNAPPPTHIDPSAPNQSTQEEARAAFADVLRAAGCTSHTAYDAALALIKADPRYHAFRSNGERRAAFAEFVQVRRREEEEEAREAVRAAKKALGAALDGAGLDPEVARLADAEVALAGSAAWAAVTEARDREAAFDDWRRERERDRT